MRISAGLPTGVTALLFAAARQRRELEERLAARLAAAGYAEVVLPVLDYLEPYEPLLTAAGRAELYRFVGRDGELLALRADFTPMLARLLAPRLPSLELPLRLFYRGDVVRYREDRAGRPREVYQLGAELLGETADPAAAEREALALFVELLLAGAARPVEVVLGVAGALDRPLLAAGPDAAALADAVARRERGAARRAGAVVAEVVERGVPRDPAALGPEAGARVEALLALRDELAAAYPEADLAVDLAEFAHQALDPQLLEAVGERAYYDGLVFHAYVGAAALPAGGGGRYDRLFRLLGAPVPAVGFALTVERLLGSSGTLPSVEGSDEGGEVREAPAPARSGAHHDLEAPALPSDFGAPPREPRGPGERAAREGEGA